MEYLKKYIGDLMFTEQDLVGDRGFPSNVIITCLSATRNIMILLRTISRVPFLAFPTFILLDCDLPIINPEQPLRPTSLDPGLLEGTVCLSHLHNLNMVLTQNERSVHKWMNSNN